jgi:hypothetical protein
LLLLLLILATGLRAWSIRHTEVASRDSIGYIRYVHELETQRLRKVLRNNQHHPGYPAVLLAVSLPVRYWLGGTTPTTMQLSAQLTSALTGVLLVIPMFCLGRLLFDRGGGFWAAALFQCLPVGAHVMADGLSDPTFLLIAAVTLLAAGYGFRSGRLLPFAICGVGTGLAYLTRPEGVLLGGAVMLVLLGAQALPASRRAWAQVLRAGAVLILATVIVGLPYALTIRSFTNKTTGHRMWGDRDYKKHPGEDLSERRPPQIVGGRQVFATTLAAWGAQASIPWCVEALGIELDRGFGHVAWLPALLGLWWYRARLREPGAAVLLLVCLLQAVVLARVCYVMGYVSERHVLIIVLCGSFWAAAALQHLPGRLSAASAWLAVLGRPHCRMAWSLVLLLSLVGSGLAATWKPLHGNRAGHHAAGLWLADHADPADPVFDPYCWSHFYAGKIFQEGVPQPVALDGQSVGYVVFEQSDNAHARLPFVPIARELMAQGRVVYRWVPSPRARKRDKAEEVDVYAVPIEIYGTILGRHNW